MINENSDCINVLIDIIIVLTILLIIFVKKFVFELISYKRRKKSIMTDDVTTRIYRKMRFEENDCSYKIYRKIIGDINV